MSRKMKDSGIYYIGEIPENWNISKYKFHSESRMGETILASQTTVEKDEKHVIPVYSATQDDSVFGYVEKTNVKLHRGDIVIPARGNSIGCATLISDENATCTQTTICNFKIRNIVNAYLYYCNWAFKDEWYKYDGSAIPQITVNQVINNGLPLPSLAEQRLIADFLDEKCSQIDEISKKIQEEINILEEYKKSIITETVIKGLDPNAEMKDSGIGWIGKVPATWELNRVANLFAERNEPGEESLPFLSVSINSGISDRELSDEETSRQFIRADAKKNKKVYPGDIVYNMMRAWQGAIGAVRTIGMVSAAYVTAKPLKVLDTRYFEYLLRTSTAIQEMNKYSYGIMDFRKRLYWSYFRNIKLCVPPFEEQQAIADYADSISKEIELLIHTKKQQLSTLEEYKKSLIYEYVTGKKEVPCC